MSRRRWPYALASVALFAGLAAFLTFRAPGPARPGRAYADKPASTAPPPAALTPLPFEPIDVKAERVSISRRPGFDGRVGQLIFRGGLKLTSDDGRFGGISGLEIDDQNVATALSDRGYWFRGKLTLDGEGTLVGVSDWGAGFIRDQAGVPLEGLRNSDSEDMTRLPNGLYAVSFERRHRIALYDLDHYGPAAPAQSEFTPPGAEKLSENRGMESIAASRDPAHKGEIIAIAEQSGAAAMWRYLPDRRVWKHLKFHAGFLEASTSLDGLPIGEGPEEAPAPAGYVGVYRRISLVSVFAAAIYFLPESALSGPEQAVIRPVRLAELKAPMRLDNFECMAAAWGPAAPNGRRPIRLYIASDDNYSPAQETLLYAFDWFPDPPAPLRDVGRQIP